MTAARPSSAIMVRLLVLAAGLGAPGSWPALADEAPQASDADLARRRSADGDERLWSVGLQVGVLDAPAGHLGLPLDDIAGIPFDAPVEIVVRRQLAGTRTALNAGAGFPHGALGLSVWLGFELFQPVVGTPRDLVALEIYADPGVQVGYAGPDYFVRHGGDFVGFEYGATGPLALAMRSPVGVRLLWPRVRLDTFVEAASMVTFTPATESFFTAIVGMRFRL